jgi:hypothetical protein
MKVSIGPYRSDLIPIRRWEGKYESWRSGNMYYLDETNYTWYDKIIFGLFEGLNSLVRPLNRWYTNRERTMKIQVDRYDAWSADHTLALIIHPVLVELKKQKQGSPIVDDEDVPDHLKSTAAPPKEEEYDTDDNHHARWEYVLDEMIWAFEQHTNYDRNEDQFVHNIEQLDFEFVPITDGKLAGKGYSSMEVNYQKDPTKPAYWEDKEGKKAHSDRIANGRRLFGKYYDGLWD